MLLKRAQADRTSANYKSKRKQWTDFCDIYNLNHDDHHNETTYLWYVAHRFETTKNKKNSIQKELSGIISLENATRLHNRIDRHQYFTLKKAFKGMATFPDRQSDKSKPIRDFAVMEMMPKYPQTSYDNILWKAMICFGKGFALRCSEYAAEYSYPTKSTIYWSNLKFFGYKYHDHSDYYLEFTITYSKTNKNWVTETLTKKCQCHTRYKEICVVHVMAYYKMICKNNLDDHKNSIVFRHLNGKPVTCT